MSDGLMEVYAARLLFQTGQLTAQQYLEVLERSSEESKSRHARERVLPDCSYRPGPGVSA